MKRNYSLIHEKTEIKMLILFILCRLPEPVSFEAITELTMCEDGISYFDLVDCLTDLVKTEHLLFTDGKYSVTERGVRNGKITENGLPFSVRMHAENMAFDFRSRQNRNDMIKTSHQLGPDGSCKVSLSLADGLGEIISLEMFAVNEQQALELEKGFRKNAESVYNAMVGVMLG